MLMIQILTYYILRQYRNLLAYLYSKKIKMGQKIKYMEKNKAKFLKHQRQKFSFMKYRIP